MLSRARAEEEQLLSAACMEKSTQIKVNSFVWINPYNGFGMNPIKPIQDHQAPDALWDPIRWLGAHISGLVLPRHSLSTPTL
eukprot:scaffold78619_cov18-Tisochrysis_lutea.AAC.1